MGTFELIGDLSVIFGMDIFDRSLKTVFFTYMTNTAASVREMGVAKVKTLGEAFGADWITSTLVPAAVESFNVEQ